MTLCSHPLRLLFQSTPPREGGDTMDLQDPGGAGGISIHAPPRGGRRIFRQGYPVRRAISIHAPPRGGRLRLSRCQRCQIVFQSTPPARGATTWGKYQTQRAKISIHAPREGGDVPHMLRCFWQKEFQSTPPARGATERSYRHKQPVGFQSTPPARGATHVHLMSGRCVQISIHAPREGGDRPSCASLTTPPIFQSTPPARGATPANFKAFIQWAYANFNPRPPRGGRLVLTCPWTGATIPFQSTPPARGATADTVTANNKTILFQSTPPARGATCCKKPSVYSSGISIHAPREGGDSAYGLNPCYQAGFQSTPPARGATPLLRVRHNIIIVFQSTPPARGATRRPA